MPSGIKITTPSLSPHPTVGLENDYLSFQVGGEMEVQKKKEKQCCFVDQWWTVTKYFFRCINYNITALGGDK